jgi:hypothetical protein
MKLETILNAYDKACSHADHLSGQYKKPDRLEILYYRRVRQYKAFRARIPKMDERQKIEIGRLQGLIEVMDESFDELVKLGVEKDAKIASLERAIVFRETGR